jgi:Transposase family tnp2
MFSPLDHHFISTINRFSIIAQVTMFLAVVCTVIMGISRRDGDFVLGLLQIIITLAFQPLDGQVMHRQHQDILSQIPGNVRTALSKFDLDAKTITYAVCPTCHCTYKPLCNNGSTDPVYPTRCTNKPTLESEECGEVLCRNDGENVGAAKPVKPFVYYSFHNYLAGLLSRKDLEEVMDRSCDDLMDSLNDPPPIMTMDVWEAQFLRTFAGPIPKTLFIDRQGEGRYGFVLNYDSFNVEGMRIRGASTSCGLISMSCLNLPPEIRNKPEYMYCLIIPGPKSPSLTDLNHYFKPFIDDMVMAWEKGVQFSRTALHPTGRFTQSAIIMAVNDLPAARHASGLAAATSHHYCSVCKCWHQ